VHFLLDIQSSGSRHATVLGSRSSTPAAKPSKCIEYLNNKFAKNYEIEKNMKNICFGNKKYVMQNILFLDNLNKTHRRLKSKHQFPYFILVTTHFDKNLNKTLNDAYFGK